MASLQHPKPTDRIAADAPTAGLNPTGTPLYETRNVTKKYRPFMALDHMNFYIGHNEVVGLLGDNGAGIETIIQDIALVDSMSITRNIFMGREITNRFGFMDHKRMEDVAIDILGSAVQISGIDGPRKKVGFISGGQKQAVAIARAVHFKRSILLLDEPTSVLSGRDTEHLLAKVRDLQKDGPRA